MGLLWHALKANSNLDFRSTSLGASLPSRNIIFSPFRHMFLHFLLKFFFFPLYCNALQSMRSQSGYVPSTDNRVFHCILCLPSWRSALFQLAAGTALIWKNKPYNMNWILQYHWFQSFKHEQVCFLIGWPTLVFSSAIWSFLLFDMNKMCRLACNKSFTFVSSCLWYAHKGNVASCRIVSFKDQHLCSSVHSTSYCQSVSRICKSD